jgi:hypothetical protein
MELIATPVVAANFHQAESALDEALKTALLSLAESTVVIEDHSSRSGFEKSGYPMFVWWFRFKFDRRLSGETWRAQVDIEYRESITQGESSALTSRWTAEVFGMGAPSRYRRSEEERHRLEDIAGIGMSALIRRGLERAESALHDLRPFGT